MQVDHATATRLEVCGGDNDNTRYNAFSPIPSSRPTLIDRKA